MADYENSLSLFEYAVAYMKEGNVFLWEPNSYSKDYYPWYSKPFDAKHKVDYLNSETNNQYTTYFVVRRETRVVEVTLPLDF